jgi:hypothetical protein
MVSKRIAPGDEPTRTSVRARRVSGLALAATLVVPSFAGAQAMSVYAVGAVDGDDTNIQLFGVSVRPAGLGLKPVGNLQVYRLGIETLTGTTDIYSVTPSAGLRYSAPAGAVEARVGYNFQDDDGTDILFFEGGDDGINSTLQAMYWGGEPELQGLANYAWEEGSLFTQGQATVGIVQLAPGEIGLGAEAVWQGDLNDSAAYRARQFGPVLRWSSGTGLVSAFSGGWQDSNLADDTWYLRLVFVYDR